MTETSLVRVNVDNHLVQYKQMCRAIAVCHGVDECKEIIDKSVAMAAYYAQIKDTQTELMFHRIKLRAWRRISELFSSVDMTKCETQSAKVKKIRASFLGDPTVEELSDTRLSEIVKLMTVSGADFEYAIKQNIAGSLADFFRRLPEFEAAKARNLEELEAQAQARMQRDERFRAEMNEQNERTTARRKREDEHLNELCEASNAAMKEIGITLERKDRAEIKQVVFLIKKEIHSVMRQAAFDKKITMQEVLRRGLKLWLEANGYDAEWDSNQNKAA